MRFEPDLVPRRTLLLGGVVIAALSPDADFGALNRDLLADSPWRGPGDGWYWLDEGDPG